MWWHDDDDERAIAFVEAEQYYCHGGDGVSMGSDLSSLGILASIESEFGLSVLDDRQTIMLVDDYVSNQ